MNQLGRRNRRPSSRDSRSEGSESQTWLAFARSSLQLTLLSLKKRNRLPLRSFRVQLRRLRSKPCQQFGEMFFVNAKTFHNRLQNPVREQVVCSLADRATRRRNHRHVLCS